MMTRKEFLQHRLNEDFCGTDPERLRDLGELYRGKVRDVYQTDRDMVMITTDRLSAFDVVLTSVPLKGAVLNAIALHAFEQTEDICPNHLISAPHPNVMHVQRAVPLQAEIIVRRYITGSLWRDYQAGQSDVYDVGLAKGLRCDQRFDTPIITPSTKAAIGEHDQPISRGALVSEGLVEKAHLDAACDYALALFARGEQLAAERGLILVDTKYEFGLVGGQLVVIDEIHTADSSRYWRAETYAERFAAGQPQHMLDKENIRQWLIEQGWQGQGEPPAIPDAVRIDLSEKYIDLYERLLGRSFNSKDFAPVEDLYGVCAALFA